MNLRWKSAVRNLAAAMLLASPAFGDEPEMVAAEEVMDTGSVQICESCAAATEEEEGPWTLTNLFDRSCGGNWLSDHGFALYGNLAQSFTFNFQGPSDRFNGPVTWTDRSNEYQLNQLYLTFERTTNTEDKAIDIGGRFDLLYGTNARFVQAYGLDTSLVENEAFYGLVLPQMYGEVAVGGVKVKAGRFISPVGYFTVDTTLNFFNTIPYTYQYGEPFTHTGIVASWNMGENLALSSGVIRGWDNWNSQNDFATPGVGFLGTATYTFDSGASVALVFVYSNEATQDVLVPGAKNFAPRYFQTFVYQQPIGEKFNYIFQSDFGNQDDAIAGTRKSAQWYGVNQYLIYQQSDTLSWGVNFEWFQDDDGFRVGGFLPLSAASSYRGLPTTRLGYEGSFFQMTMGPKWQPHPNLFVRPNLRFDFFAGNNNNADNLSPFNDGSKDWQGILATDIVVKF